MIWLLLGVLLWSGVHLVPSMAIPVKTGAMQRLGGEQPYKGVFSLCLLIALVLIVLGWRSSMPAAVYSPPAWGRGAANGMVFAALLLFAVSNLPSNLRRLVRHPQLTGVMIWAGAHLLANGDRRSLVLFGGFGLWALLEIVFISRRDGAWEKPEVQPITGEWKPLLAATVAFVALYLLHPWIAGVSPAP